MIVTKYLRWVKFVSLTMAAIKVGQSFESWESFAVAKAAYSAEKNIQLVVRGSRTVKNANERLAQGKPRYEEKLKYAYATLACKHYGVPRVASRGIRPNQR